LIFLTVFQSSSTILGSGEIDWIELPHIPRRLDMTTHDIEKALEIWTLQNLLNFSIILGILALGLALMQQYYRSVGKHLSLRVSIEIWRMLTTMFVDIALIIIVLVGYTVLNPDIMADIKIAIPFVPFATILFTIALVLRIFHGGHQVANPNFLRSVWLMFAANCVNIIGFTMIMEAPSSEYLTEHPSAFWLLLKTTLRSNANLELSQTTFYIFFPIMTLVFLWGFRSAIRQLKEGEGE
jgi:vacuolar-type H+-ATPase subunit I/STV1